MELPNIMGKQASLVGRMRGEMDKQSRILHRTALHHLSIVILCKNSEV
jgi:hypothetical protein